MNIAGRLMFLCCVVLCCVVLCCVVFLCRLMFLFSIFCCFVHALHISCVNTNNIIPHEKMKADQQSVTKNLPFKTKQSSVVLSVSKYQRFEEEVSKVPKQKIYHTPIHCAM